MKTCIDKHEFTKRFLDGKSKYYRTAFCYVKNEHDALDIIGETAYKGLQKLHTLKEPSYFDTWIIRIIINTSIDFLRKNGRYQTHDDSVLEFMPSENNSLSVEASLDLYDALECLNEKDKTCVMLKYFEEYTFSEISQILCEPQPTIKSRLYRSLKKMREFLEGGETYEYR